jgi:hypothetical protein
MQTFPGACGTSMASIRSDPKDSWPVCIRIAVWRKGQTCPHYPVSFRRVLLQHPCRWLPLDDPRWSLLHSQATPLRSERLRQAGSGLCPAGVSNYRTAPFSSRAKTRHTTINCTRSMFRDAPLRLVRTTLVIHLEKKNECLCFEFLYF